MDDSELTKKAIEELIKEMNDKEKDGLLTERKKNPLGKPNKRFLGRTINSIMKHNKRQSDNNHQRCQRKLRELDAKQRNHEHRKKHKKHRKRSHTESSHEVISSDCEDRYHTIKMKKNLRKVKRKRRKKKQISSSSSSSSSSESSNSNSSSKSISSGSTNSSKVKKYKNSKSKKHISYAKDEENNELFSQMACDSSVGYYINPHMAYAVMAYGHVNHVLHQQMVQQQQIIKDELEESVEIPSDLSISYHSESSLNISLHSSSAEEDENGILTFKLLSSDEEGRSKKEKVIPKIKAKEHYDLVTLVESDSSISSSVKSCISLESTSQKQNNEILLLSSSASDCDELEIIGEVSEPIPIALTTDIDEEKKGTFESNEIENVLHTIDDNLPENNKEAAIGSTKLADTEKSSKIIEVFDDSIKDTEIIKKMENSEESDKNNITLQKSQLPENSAITTMIDLTEE